MKRAMGSTTSCICGSVRTLIYSLNERETEKELTDIDFANNCKYEFTTIVGCYCFAHESIV